MSNNTIEAVRFNESMNTMDCASKSTMFELKHLGGGPINGDQEQQAMDQQLQYDQLWKSEDQWFSTICDLEVSQRESLPWCDNDNPVHYSMDFLNSTRNYAFIDL